MVPPPVIRSMVLCDNVRRDSDQPQHISLDGLLSAYKRGAQLLEFCRSRLDAVEEQVKVLEEGQLKPWTRP